MIDKEKNFLSVVVYIHDGEEQLKSFFPVLFKTLKDNFEKYEIICVDDDASDESIDIVKEYAYGLGEVMLTIIHMGGFCGLELSMNAGTDLSIGDFVMEFDSLYMDYSEQLIMSLYRKALEGYDIVAAVPEKTRKFSSRIFYWIYNRYSLTKNALGQETFRIVSRRAINRVQALNKSINYRKAVYSNCGLPIAKITYKNCLKHKKYTDSQPSRMRRDLAFESLALFTDAIQKGSAIISILFLMFTILCGGYTWLTFFGAHKPVEGWISLMLFLSVSFFGIFLILTLILKYLSVILNVVFKKQRYLVESIEKITNS